MKKVYFDHNSYQNMAKKQKSFIAVYDDDNAYIIIIDHKNTIYPTEYK